MKKLLCHSRLILVVVLTTGSAHAYNYCYWDINGANAGCGSATPNGNWSDASWSLLTGTTTPASNPGTTPTGAWVDSADAHFSAGSDATGSYTINVDTSPNVGAFYFDYGNVTLAGSGTLNLIANGDGFSVNSGLTATFSNVIAGTAGGFINMSGRSGTLVLAGTNTFTGNSTYGGVRCVSGTVVAKSDYCFGTGANSFINMAGGTLSFPAGTHNIANKFALTANTTSYLAGSGTVNLNGPIALQLANAYPPTIIFNGTGDVFFNGIVSDVTRGAFISGPGRVIFNNAANNWTGWLYLRRGNLALGNNSVLSGQLHFDGTASSSFLSAYGGARTISQVVSFDNYGYAGQSGLGITISGTNALTFAGTVDLYTNDPSETIILQNSADTIVTGSIVSTVPGNGSGSSVSLGANRCGLNIGGNGRIIFQNGNSTYTGDTVINSGTLYVANTVGSATGSGNVDTFGSGTLAGTGIITGNVTNNGAVAGGGAGTLTTGNQTWNGGSQYKWQINSVNGAEGVNPGWDFIQINGTLTINAGATNPIAISPTALTTNRTPGNVFDFSPATNYAWRILTASGGIIGFDPAVFRFERAYFNLVPGTFSLSVTNNDHDLILSFIPSISTQPIPGIFGTGMNGAGALLAPGSVDPHYTLIASADTNTPGPDALVPTSIPTGWMPNSASTNSQWIAPALDQNKGSSPGRYVYRTTVDLGNLDPGATVLVGRWAMDDNGEILLNGASTGNTIGGYTLFSGFMLTNGFVAGMNTIDFVVTNGTGSATNPTAVRVEMIGVGAAGAARIARQPQDQEVQPGGTATFTVLATGSPPLSYQWFRDGVIISGATASSYSLTNVQPINGAALYWVVVSNALDAVTSSNAALFVDGPPFFVTNPLNQTGIIGGTVTFSVRCSGTPPLDYQWYFNDDSHPIDGATTSSLTLANLQPANAGNYYVWVNNGSGFMQSSSGTLTVIAASRPGIISQPQSQTVRVGANVTFTVAASGTAPLSYQWQFNGTNISGAIIASYAITNAQTDNSGSYSVVVTNIAGLTNSAPAILTVVPRPILPVSLAGNNIVITWPDPWTLQSATNVTGPYLDVPGAASPFTNTVNSNSQRFFRVR